MDDVKELLEALKETNSRLDRIIKLLEDIRRGLPSSYRKMAEVESALSTGILDAVTLLSVPDHLRKTLVAVAKLGGEATSEEVSKTTGRARAVESAYLNQLATLGYVVKERKGRKVYFIIPQFKEEE
ncbi:MAG: transcriptional regulator [Thermoprotei archaeon]|nr:MAG: transcriptional regulator [Thermoprotei archaeon]